MEANNNVDDDSGGVDHRGSLVVHVRGNSDSEMEALFGVLEPTSSRPLQKPLKMRNLPASFFSPPAHRQSPIPTAVSHSREGSSDSTYGGGTTPVGVGGAISPTPPQPQHFRHHSSPATLQQSLSVAPTSHVHSKQHSFDALADELGTLPQGWEEATTGTGQIYFINHVTQTTTWEDPRKKQTSNSSLNIPSPQLSPAISAQSQLPQASSQAQPSAQLVSAATTTQTLTTSSNSVTSSTNNVSTSLPQILTTTSAAAASAADSTTGSTANTALSLQGVPLPDGWEQGITPGGEMYFMNHQDKTTTWFDPRIPRHLQTAIGLKTTVAPLAPPQTSSSGNPQLVHTLPPVAPNGHLTSASRIRHNQSPTLQRLHQERAKLKERQQELMRNNGEFSLRRNLRDDNVDMDQRSVAQRLQHSSLITSIPALASSVSTSLVLSPSTISQSGQSQTTNELMNSADPFMAATEFHNRQGSADSGLGLGGNYTHPHTPEDFLAAMEDSDISSAVDDLKQTNSSPMIVGSEIESMDSEDLVPSITITDDIGPLAVEFLNDMLEPSKLNQTWL